MSKGADGRCPSCLTCERLPGCEGFRELDTGIADGLLGGNAEDGDSDLAFRNPDSLGEPARPIPAMSDQPSVRCGRDSHAPRVVQVRSVDELSRRLGQTLSGGANSAMLQALNQLVRSAIEVHSPPSPRPSVVRVSADPGDSADLGNDSLPDAVGKHLRNDALRSEFVDGFDRRLLPRRSLKHNHRYIHAAPARPRRTQRLGHTHTSRLAARNRPPPPGRSASPDPVGAVQGFRPSPPLASLCRRWTVEWDAEMRLARGRFALPGLRPGLVR
jgi:hypothetical protein